MIMCVLLCYPVSIHMSQLLSTGRPISSYFCIFSASPFIAGHLLEVYFTRLRKFSMEAYWVYSLYV